MPPYCRGSKYQKNGLAPLEERKRLCDPPNLPNLISFICLFPINMQPLALFLRKEPGGLSSISSADSIGGFSFFRPFTPRPCVRFRPPLTDPGGGPVRIGPRSRFPASGRRSQW